jgi:hypothetical protein
MNNKIISLESNLSGKDGPAETPHDMHLIIDGSNTQNVTEHIEEDNKALKQGLTNR